MVLLLSGTKYKVNKPLYPPINTHGGKYYVSTSLKQLPSSYNQKFEYVKILKFWYFYENLTLEKKKTNKQTKKQTKNRVTWKIESIKDMGNTDKFSVSFSVIIRA